MNKTRQEFGNSKTTQFPWAVDKEAPRLLGKQNLIHITVLSAIALVIGIYLIATTVLIAKDGTMYIECARQIADNPVEAVRNMPPCPGYPFLIYLMHKVTGLFNDTESIQGWIISAQLVSLLSKVIASVALYFVGSYFVGPRISFWGVLILSILPDSAEFGSDALTEWPHLMFLTTGFLLLLLGAQYRKNWMFGWAGIIAGLGYLVRSEGCQLVLYGSAWLIFNLVRPQGKMKRTKATGALILLLAGFAVIAIPYMRSKGYVFPEQGMWKFPALLSMNNDNIGSAFNMNMCLAGLSIKGIIGNETLITNMCETLMYYFAPFLLIGCYYYFRKQSKTLEQAFFAAAFIVFNIVMLCWQSHIALSRRYSLALVAFTIFYIPVGLHTIACWLSEKSPKNNVSMQKNRQHWFLVLLVIGMAICLPKLLRPMRIDKQGYRDAAEWLRKNTAPTDIIAVPDKRIAFYAERTGFEYQGDNISALLLESAAYIVKITKIQYDEESKPERTFQYYAGEAEDSNESNIFLSEMKKNISLKGLVGYWAANNNTLDYSIYRNHATAHGRAGYAQSKWGQAFSLTASSGDYIDCGNNASLNPTDSVTLFAWIYPVTASIGTIIAKNGPYFIQFCADGKITAGIYAGSPPSWTVATGASVLPLNAWHHVLVTYDGSYIKIYIDGEIDGTPLAKSGDMAVTPDSVRIGYGAKGLDHYFRGLIDEVMIFHEALSSDKIKALHEMVESKTVPTFGTNVNAYPIFDCWKIERKYSVWVDERMKKKQLCVYKIE